MERVDIGKRRSPAMRVIVSAGWMIPVAVGFIFQRLISGHPELAERYLSRGLFRIVSMPITWIVSRIPFSLTESAAVLALPAVLFLFWRLVRRLSRTQRMERAQAVGKIARGILWTLSLAYLMFMVLHGWNYARLPLASSLSIPVTERSADDLAIGARWLASQATLARLEILEDENGVMRLSDSLQATLRSAGSAFDSAAIEYPLLDGASTRPKGVLLSRYWSYTGITGMYFPLFVEANVNIDAPHSSLPDTILHEIAHTRGFAREDEAGFLAFLTGIRSSSPDFRYSAYLQAFISLSNQLYTYDQQVWTETWEYVSEGIHRDLAAAGAYWKQFEGPVQQVSEQVNNTYLEANLQKDGVFSYGRKADLILAYLFAEDPGQDALLEGPGT